MSATVDPAETTTVPAGGPAWGATWPVLDGFRALATSRRVVPVVRRVLADDVTPVGLYRTLAQGRPGTFVLESAESDGRWARYSFVGVASRAPFGEREPQQDRVGRRRALEQRDGLVELRMSQQPIGVSREQVEVGRAPARGERCRASQHHEQLQFHRPLGLAKRRSVVP